MPKHRVLVSVNITFDNASPARALLEAAGCEVVEDSPQVGWPDAQTRTKLEGIDAILAGGESFNASTMDRADRLKVIARNGVGYDLVDVDYCTEQGILVTNTPGAMADAVADEAIGLLLACVRSFVAGDQRVKSGGKYDVPLGEDLAAMTLGLVGCGHIGLEVVRRALAFKTTVLVYDPWADADTIRAAGAEPVADLEQFLPRCDAITLHTPLTAQSANMVDAAFLARMKPGSYLINTARGGLVDEPALIAALDSGHLRGAGLDCQATEPPEGISLDLVRRDEVLAMPHAGSKTMAARKKMALVAAQTIADALQGRAPKHLVNPQVLESVDWVS